jgi:hypothetical protein
MATRGVESLLNLPRTGVTGRWSLRYPLMSRSRSSHWPKLSRWQHQATIARSWPRCSPKSSLRTYRHIPYLSLPVRLPIRNANSIWALPRSSGAPRREAARPRLRRRLAMLRLDEASYSRQHKILGAFAI